MIVASDQLEWQAEEIGVLIHFNIATYISNDGCTGQYVPPVSLFNPYMLSTDNWAQTMADLGARYAVLVAKVKTKILHIESHGVNVEKKRCFSLEVL